MKVLLISGPTAGGKSLMARRLAEELDGEVINADALQVYRELRLLSARPSAEEMGDVRHHLFGHISAARSFSAGTWLKAALEVIAGVDGRGRLPIIVGGTGLYFHCLTRGLAEIPEASGEIRKSLRARLEREGAAELHRALVELDPDLAARLPRSDTQRILRGLEVYEATGASLSSWLKLPPVRRFEADFIKVVLLRDRGFLVEAAERRLDAMVSAGVLDEVRVLMELGLPPEMPAMKALGLREFAGHLAGEVSLDEALEQAKVATRRYIRRQLTWIRTQMSDWVGVSDEVALRAEVRGLFP